LSCPRTHSSSCYGGHTRNSSRETLEGLELAAAMRGRSAEGAARAAHRAWATSSSPTSWTRGAKVAERRAAGLSASVFRISSEPVGGNAAATSRSETARSRRPLSRAHSAHWRGMAQLRRDPPRPTRGSLNPKVEGSNPSRPIHCALVRPRRSGSSSRDTRVCSCGLSGRNRGSGPRGPKRPRDRRRGRRRSLRARARVRSLAASSRSPSDCCHLTTAVSAANDL
jgi:hypothetical protein